MAPRGTLLTEGSPRLANQLLLAHSPVVHERRVVPELYPHAPVGGMALADTHVEGIPAGGDGRVLDAGERKRQARPQLHFPTGFRVLHAEDDALVRRTFELRVLKKLGVPFDVAMNGAEAVHLILEEKREYALVLMDNQMPVLTGEKATRALRAGGFKGIIVGMTGDPKGCSERDEFEAAGLSLCVEKDTPGIQRIAQVLGSFALNEELEEEPGACSTLLALPVEQTGPAVDCMLHPLSP
ncbi:hypothetical protein T492DRAFT_839432 [Pavlovales sp. CCMP2436]|nr:hypothetical protein T492DRAFT_839432 [Pavlovales sp. CCMP2436]